MIQEKLNFLLNEFPRKLEALDPQTTPLWGKMNVLQMIEHMSEAIYLARGIEKLEVLTTPERLPGMKAFMLSEKEFKPNTKNILLPEIPSPSKFTDNKAAIEVVKAELKEFVRLFESQPGLTTVNSFFGELNYEDWIVLLHKHAVHHLKQFGC